MTRLGKLLCLAATLAGVILVMAGVVPVRGTHSTMGQRGARAPLLWAVLPSLGKASATPAPSATPLPTTTPTFTPSPTATRRPTPTPTATPTRPPVTSRAIFVDQNAQMVHVYENGAEVKALPCSTGKPLPTQATPPWTGLVGPYYGTIYAFGTYADDAWYLFEASGDILIHGAPYTVADGVKAYQDMDSLAVRPASHGCIRLRPEDARWFTEWDPRGVPIAISPLTRKAFP